MNVFSFSVTVTALLPDWFITAKFTHYQVLVDFDVALFMQKLSSETRYTRCTILKSIYCYCLQIWCSDYLITKSIGQCTCLTASTWMAFPVMNILWSIFRPDVQLIGSAEGMHQPASDVELDDVQFNPRLEEVLNNEQWVDDATWVHNGICFSTLSGFHSSNLVCMLHISCIWWRIWLGVEEVWHRPQISNLILKLQH